MTDEELDAQFSDEVEVALDPMGALRLIATLRTQLAEAKADKEKLGRELNLARYGQPDFSWQVHKEALAAANARADLAKAERAAQIEADAGIAEYYANQDYCAMGYPEDGGIAASGTAETICREIRSQPHDRTALDRMLAEAREKAVREAMK